MTTLTIEVTGQPELTILSLEVSATRPLQVVTLEVMAATAAVFEPLQP